MDHGVRVNMGISLGLAWPVVNGLKLNEKAN